MDSGKKIWISILFFCLSLFLSYCPLWVPYYVNLFQTEKVSILGKLSQYEMPCTAQPVGDSFCSNQYVIPKSSIKNASEDYVLGLGQILVYTKIGCYEDSKFVSLSNTNEERSVNQNYQTLHNYYVVPVSMFKDCVKNIAVQSWAAKHDLRHGYYGGLVTNGPPLPIDRIKKLIEFILIIIPQNLAMVGLAFFVLINHYFGSFGIE